MYELRGFNKSIPVSDVEYAVVMLKRGWALTRIGDGVEIAMTASTVAVKEGDKWRVYPIESPTALNVVKHDEFLYKVYMIMSGITPCNENSVRKIVEIFATMALVDSLKPIVEKLAELAEKETKLPVTKWVKETEEMLKHVKKTKSVKLLKSLLK